MKTRDELRERIRVALATMEIAHVALKSNPRDMKAADAFEAACGEARSAFKAYDAVFGAAK